MSASAVAAVPERVQVAWDAVTAGWEEPARHAAFISIVVATDSLAWAARQYGQHKGDPIASAQLERLRKAGLAAMFATATPKPDKKRPFRMVQILLFVVVIMVVTGLLILRSLPQRPREKPPAPPVLPSQVR